MKRSEMIELMEDIAINYIPYEGKIPDYIPDMVEFMLLRVESNGMLPPLSRGMTPKELLNKYPEYFIDDGYHGIVCKSSHWDYHRELPDELLKYVYVSNCGDYSMVMVKGLPKTSEWEDDED